MKTLELLRRWHSGELDLTEQLHASAEAPEEREEVPYIPHDDLSRLERKALRQRRVYIALCAVCCVVFAAVMILSAAHLPPYGDPDAPTVNEVAERYVEKGTAETGAVNTVAGMILDYRAFDTLGESFVLFTAMCCVTLLMTHVNRKPRVYPPDAVRYAEDPIVATVCRFVIPIILVFGIYILLNGHLSPGGGFSGGAILAAGLIIFAMVWGEGRATRAIPFSVLQRTVVCSLSFYALSKTYSVYTGANHLDSFISPGTPGRILSAGLILPLNVAVGLVVCCTMYSFYMYFRRGLM